MSAGPLRVPAHVAYEVLEGEAVLLHLGVGEYFQLDPIGTRMLQLLAAGSDREQVLAALMADYEVEPAILATDFDRLVDELLAAGLVEAAPNR
ncbi:MAG TPA: PqqD family protein [Acidimicrobiales bacterium]|nr:PqqD family protein [Acidimicrobiales bacterium]